MNRPFLAKKSSLVGILGVVVLSGIFCNPSYASSIVTGSSVSAASASSLAAVQSAIRDARDRVFQNKSIANSEKYADRQYKTR